MKKSLSLLVALVMTMGVFSGCSKKTETESSSKVKKGEYVLNVGTVLTEADPLFSGLQTFQKNVAERTNGAVEIKLFSSSQLGNDEDLLEQAKIGTGVGVVTDPGRLSNYIKDFAILGAPYLVDNYEEALKLLDTSVFKELSDKFEKDGLKILAYNYFQGTRHLFTSKPITSPQDLSGQRIRSSGSAIVSSTIKNIGANPTVLPWAEAYSGMQQKVVDGVEVHYSAAVGSSMFEVAKNLSKTAHFQLLTGLVISNGWFEKLPADYQKIVVEEAYNGGKYASEQVLAKDKEFEKQLLDKGVKIVDCDVAAFKAAAEKTYDELGYRDLKNKIDVELGKK